MERLLLLCLTILALFGYGAAAYGNGLTIAKNKKSDYVIAVSEKRIPAEVTASKELQEYIFKSTGVELPIVVESQLKTGRPAIMLGQTEYALSKGLWTKEPEKWIIKTVNNRLVLTGGRPRGTLYAVYHFLEDVMDIHWWTIWDESVPNYDVLTISVLNRTGTPGFAYRDIYDSLHLWPKKFYARNRVNGHFSIIPWEYGGTIQYGPPHHVHTFNLYFPPEKYYDTHPEYFSLSKGKRIRDGQLCLTNEDVFNEWVAKMKDYIRSSYAAADAKGEPRPVYFSVSQNDWSGSCECDNCRAIYEKENHSGLSLTFVNAVAEEIEKEYPDVIVDTLAYYFYEEAPKTVKPRHNVRIRLCDGGGDILHAANHPNNRDGLRRLREWKKITENLDIWDYGVLYTPNLPAPTQLDYHADVNTYKTNGVDGIFIEMENCMTTDMWDMKVWMLAKLYENPKANSSALVKQFTDGYYGAAGKYIREYLRSLHSVLQKKPSYLNTQASIWMYSYLDYDLIKKCDALFDSAEAAVANEPVILDRVRLARTSLDRAICYLSPLLYTRYVQRGTAADFGLSPEVSGKRAAAILRKMSDIRFPDHKRLAQHAYDHADKLEKQAVPIKYASLPANFSGLAPESVTDFSPYMFRLYKMDLTLDPDSAHGAIGKIDVAGAGRDASQYYVKPSQGLLMGVYNVRSKTARASASITYDQIRPGYNFYKLGPTKLKLGDYFYITWSWIIQVDLDMAMTADPEQEYEIYASIKFEGPNFPNADVSKSDAILVDRVVVLAVDK